MSAPMFCQAHVAGEKFEAWDSCSPWCRNEAITTVALTLIPNERLCEVWLCQEHHDELMARYDL